MLKEAFFTVTFSVASGGNQDQEQTKCEMKKHPSICAMEAWHRDKSMAEDFASAALSMVGSGVVSSATAMTMTMPGI